jgi:hypothetical protein
MNLWFGYAFSWGSIHPGFRTLPTVRTPWEKEIVPGSVGNRIYILGQADGSA